MKKIIYSLLLVSSAGLISACGNENKEAKDSKEVTGTTASGASDNKSSEPAQLENYKTFDHTDFSFQYPSDWKEEDYKAPNVTILAMVMSPQDDNFNENLNVLKQEAAFKNLQEALDVNVNELKKFLPNMKIEEQVVKTNNGTEYASVTYTGDQQGMNMKFRQDIYLKGAELYIVTFTALPDTWDKFKGVASNMMSSFRLK